MVILDTNIIIDHLRQQKKGKTHLKEVAKMKPKEALALSVISIQELYEGKSTRKKKEEEYLLATVAPLKILPYNFEIAQLAGEIARDLKNPIEFADATIAATTILKEASLYTLDEKHFKNIENLELFSLS